MYVYIYRYIHTYSISIYIYHIYVNTDCWQETLRDNRFRSKLFVGCVQNSDIIYIYIESVWMWSKLAILNCKPGIYIYI